ncbi:hypothetical protein [Ornithinibacillus xuwenensis]|uniref:Uncharacterized protein n=1 Tax=Ornithinibacillus xuwenensis TaxID=3144668 RepID=A0ABU9XBY8_9BACI
MNKKTFISILIPVVIIEVALMFITAPTTYVDKFGMEITNPDYYGVKIVNPLLNYHYIKFGIVILATFLISGFIFSSLRQSDSVVDSD